MKKLIAVVMAIVVLVMSVGFVTAQKDKCTTIQSGDLLYSSGHYLANESLETGFDVFGYNYQAHMFKGSYANAYLGGDGYPPYEGDDESYLNESPEVVDSWVWSSRNIDLIMKWNDAWLSNKDCDGDEALDRSNDGGGTYIGSGAWVTNHQFGSYLNDNNETCEWDYFVKIVAVPEGAELNETEGVWYNSEGEEIGEVIWGQFAIIQQVYNDMCAGEEGVLYKSPLGPGLGKY